MRDVVRTCGVRCCRIEVKWKQKIQRRTGRIRSIGLLKRRILVGESTNATITPEIMIEGAVFLDENDHVLDVRELRARSAWRRSRGRSRHAAGAPAATVDRDRRKFRYASGGTQFQKFPAIHSDTSVQLDSSDILA